MLVPQDVILIWTGTNASIPTGWVRETALDGYFPKGTADATDPGTTGGSATHSHTSPEHTHTMSSHTHTGNTYQADTSGTWGKDADNSNGDAVQDSHTHSFTSDGPSGGDLHDAITYQSCNSEPPHGKLIFIKPSQGLSPINAGIIALFDEATIPNGWHNCDGADSTPDFRNKYLKGAATSADADVTTSFGALTHTHTVDHTHTDRGHTHSGTTGDALRGGSYARRGHTGGSTCNAYWHTHGFTLPSKTTSSGSYTGTVTSETVEPAYKKLLAIQKLATTGIAQKGIVGIWIKALSLIPIGWFLCDGNHDTQDMRGMHVKIASTPAEIGDTGGANTHVHASSNSHTHSGASHNHDVPTMSQNSTQVVNPSGGGYKAIQSNHLHNQPYDGLVNNSSTAFAETTIEADTSNNEPAYKTVAFIKFLFGAGGAPLAMLI